MTDDNDGFGVILPAGFVIKYQGVNAKVDDMAVVKAMLTLPAKEWAPANVSGIGEEVSVAPSYAAKLATVGVTPGELLAWLYANVPPSERAPWIPGSANAPPGLVRTIAEAVHLAPQPPQEAPPPGPAYPTPARPAMRAEPGSASAGSTAGRAATAASRASMAAGAGQGPSGAEAGSRAVAVAGHIRPGAKVASHAASPCPPGYAVATAPNGASCLPGSALGGPLPSRPRAESAPSRVTRGSPTRGTPPAKIGGAVSHAVPVQPTRSPAADHRPAHLERPAPVKRPPEAKPASGQSGSVRGGAHYQAQPVRHPTGHPARAPRAGTVARQAPAFVASAASAVRALPRLWEMWLAAWVVLMVGGMAAVRAIARR